MFGSQASAVQFLSSQVIFLPARAQRRGRLCLCRRRRRRICGVVGLGAAGLWIVGVVRAGVLVVAGDFLPGTGARGTGVFVCAGVAVVAFCGVVGLGTAGLWIAGVVRAGVLVVAGDFSPAQAPWRRRLCLRSIRRRPCANCVVSLGAAGLDRRRRSCRVLVVAVLGSARCTCPAAADSPVVVAVVASLGGRSKLTFGLMACRPCSCCRRASLRRAAHTCGGMRVARASPSSQETALPGREVAGARLAL